MHLVPTRVRRCNARHALRCATMGSEPAPCVRSWGQVVRALPHQFSHAVWNAPDVCARQEIMQTMRTEVARALWGDVAGESGCKTPGRAVQRDHRHSWKSSKRTLCLPTALMPVTYTCPGCPRCAPPACKDGCGKVAASSASVPSTPQVCPRQTVAAEQGASKRRKKNIAPWFKAGSASSTCATPRRAS